jgi:hypothetical protein
MASQQIAVLNAALDALRDVDLSALDDVAVRDLIDEFEVFKRRLSAARDAKRRRSCRGCINE